MGSYYYAIGSARRFARREAIRCGLWLTRFKLIPGSDDEDCELGPEWTAVDKLGHGGVQVWHPIGEKNVEEAQRSAGVVKSFGGHVFAISIYLDSKPWKPNDAKFAAKRRSA